MAEQQLDRVWRFVLILIPYALIYSIPVSNGLILVLLLVSLVYFFATKGTFSNRGYFFFLSIPFWITLFGLAYTVNVKVGASILETRAPLILFPIIFYLKPPKSIDRNELLKHFILGLAATFFILLSIAVYKNFKDPWTDVWFNQWYYHYDNFTEPIDMQPLYLALYVGFGLILLIAELLGVTQYLLFDRMKRVNVIVAILCVFLVMLGVRSILIITVCLIVILCARSWIRFERKSIVAVSLVIVGIISLTLLSPVTSQRFNGLFTQNYSFSNYSLDRFIIWSVAIRCIKDEPQKFIIGGGTGSSEGQMSERYKREGITWDFEKKTNTHNQYLEFMLDTGLIGALSLIGFITIILIRFVRANEVIGWLFASMTALALIGENYLNRQQGVVFISLFLCLFYAQAGTLPEKVRTGIEATIK